MANSALGFASAVDALPTYFEFGKSLVGQGKEDLDRAMKEKLATQDLGLRASEQALREEQDKRLMDYRYADLERQRAYENNQLDLNRRKAGLDERVFNESTLPRTRAEVDNTNSMARARDALSPLNQEQVRAETGQINANTAKLKTQAEQEAYLLKQQKEQNDYAEGMRMFIENPYDTRLDDNTRRELATHFGIMANPEAKDAYTAITGAMQSGTPATPEQIAMVGRVLQPIIDQGGPNQTFLGFEPLPDHSGVRIKLRNAQGKEVYMTKGRRPVAQGDAPDSFTPAEIGQVLGLLRNAADWQDAHPEARDELADMDEARRFSRTPGEYRTIMYQRAKDRYNRDRQEEKAKEHDDRVMSQRRDKLIKDFDKWYTNQFPDMDMMSEQEQKAIQKRKSELLSDWSQKLHGATLEQLLDLDASDLPEVYGGQIGNAGGAAAAPSRGGQFNSPRVNGGR